jgi:hypothetical protein
MATKEAINERERQMEIDSVELETWSRLRAAMKPQSGKGHFLWNHARSKQKFTRWCLPYGFWLCVDGREVLFDRTYTPICQRYPGQPATMADPTEWVPWTHIENFYNDGTPETGKRRAAMTVLELWAMSKVVLSAVEQFRGEIVRQTKH